MTMKGGQAKTTLAINLAARIAKARRKVLLIDSDIQANVTTTFQRDHHCNLAHVILGKVSNFDFIQLDRYLSFLPSGGEAMVEASSYLGHTRFKDSLFKNLLSSINHRIVIIDTAPSWSDVSRNILMYVDYVIVPVVTDYLGFSGCDQIMTYIDQFKAGMLGQCKAEVLGIAITRSHPRTKLAQTITEGLRERWPDLMFSQIVEETVSIQEAPAFQQSIFDYRKGRTSGAEMYDLLCREIMRRIVQQQKNVHNGNLTENE
jgi:chromosome partitioning protein